MSSWALAVDVGVASVAAAVRDGNSVEVISVIGQESFPATVLLTEDGLMLTGPQAQVQAHAHPDHAIWWPRRALEAGDTVTVAGQEIPLAAVYAAILDRVAYESSGDRDRSTLGRLILCCPPWWTNREITVMRAAAEQAMLPAPEIALAPLTAALSLFDGAGPGQHVALLNLDGEETDTAVLRRTASGFELAGAPGRTSGPHASDPRELASQGAYELLATVTGAGLAPDELAAVYLTGTVGITSEAAPAVRAVLGIEPRLNPGSRTAAVRGALTETPATNNPPPAGLTPPVQTARSAQGRRLKAAAAVIAVIVLAAGAGVGLVIARSQQRNGASGGLGTAASSLSVRQGTIKVTRGAPDAFTATARYPIVVGLPSAAQRRVNAALRLPASRAVASFAKQASPCPTQVIPAANCGYVAVRDQVYRAGHLLSVKYIAETHFSGAADVSYTLQAVTVRTDTGAILGPSAILTAAALTTAGRDKLAAGLQAQPGISRCDQQPGWPGEKNIPPALATITISREPTVIINVTQSGVQFSFGDDVLSGTACQPIAAIPFTQLSGLITPAVISLAASQGSGHSRREGSATASGPISPHLLGSIPIKDPVVALAFTPNGKTLAVQLGNGVVELRDPATGAVRSTISLGGKLAGNVMGTMAISPDGAVIALAVRIGSGISSAVKLISTATGKVTASIPVSTATVYSLAFSPDGRTLAIATGRNLYLMDVAARTLISVSTDQHAFTGDSMYVSYSGSGKSLAVASNEGLVKVWDVRAAGFSKSITVNSSQGSSAQGIAGPYVSSATFSPDGSMVAVSGGLQGSGAAGDEPETWLWYPSTGHVRPLAFDGQVDVSDDIWSQAFSPDGKLIATGDDIGFITLWDTGTGSYLARTQAPSHISPVTAIAFGPDGTSLVTAQSNSSPPHGGSATLQLWALHAAAGQSGGSAHGLWSSATAGNTGPNLPPGIYHVGKNMGETGSWVVMLDSVEVAADGKTTFVISSKNTSTVEGQLACYGSPNPPGAAITLATGQVINSVANYCPGHKDQGTVIVASGQAVTSVSVFASSRGLSKPFTFDWIGPSGLGGTISGLTLSK